MALHDMLASLASRIAGPILDPRVVPCDTDCWLDTPDEGEPDDEPLPDEATPEQEAAVAVMYAARRAALVR